MMNSEASLDWVFASALLSLRIGPVLAFAPPFTLTRIPALFRALLGLGLAACLVSAGVGAGIHDLSAGVLVVAGLRELLLGMIFVLAFQIAYAALNVAGRTIDIQAGYGLATVVDPTSNASTPLVGSLLTMLAGAAFFAANGHIELFRLFGDSVAVIPLGAATAPHSLINLTSFISAAFLIALGVGGGVILGLFLADLGIAALSRTAPQMNVLVLGFQLKSILLLVGLPINLGLSVALMARLTRLVLDHALSLAA